jgi:hypothetical protein
MLTGLSLSLLLVGTALAQENGDGKEGASPVVSGNEVAGLAGAPGSIVVPGPPTGEAEAKTPAGTKEELIEYRVGVNGFFRGEGVGNLRLSDYSYEPKHAEGRFLYRVKPYASWHPTEYLALHLEGQGYGFTGGGRDQWDLSLYQGYLDAKIPNKELLALRAGRQEFSYGSNFMLGPDAFYNGLSFDAVRLKVQPTDSLSVDLLGGYYTTPSADGVKGNISGGYATWAISEGNAVDAYFLRDTGSTDHHHGEELNSWGVRGTAKLGAVCLEVEPVYQSGDLFNAGTGANENISAYGGHADLTAEGDLAGLRHRLWLGYAIGSGSRASADGVSSRREFRNPNNDTGLLGDMNVFGDLSGVNVGDHHASGLQIYTLGWGVDLTKELSFSANGHYFRAGAVESGLSRDIGLETDFTLTYAMSQDFSLLLAYNHLFTGPYFRGASGSGDDVHYGYAMLQFNLEKAKLKAPKL